MPSLFSRITPALVGAALLVPALAGAHTGAHPADTHTAFAAFIDGLVHPVTGIDHLAAMLAVGIWSALALRPAWLAPVAFVLWLVGGALLGHAGLTLPAIEPMVAASVLVLGLLIAVRKGMSITASVLLVGSFALFHGLAHGTELSSTFALVAMSGMVIGTVALHAAGWLIGRWAASRQVLATRVGGALVSALGLVLLARAL